MISVLEAGLMRRIVLDNEFSISLSHHPVPAHRRINRTVEDLLLYSNTQCERHCTGPRFHHGWVRGSPPAAKYTDETKPLCVVTDSHGVEQIE